MLLTWYTGITYPDSYPVMTNIPPTQSWPSRHTSSYRLKIHLCWLRGPTLYIYATQNKHKHVQRSLSVHICYLQQTHIYSRGPTLYVHINSNEDSHLLRGSTMEMGAMSHKDLTSSWGPILYIQITPNKDSKTFYSQTFFSGPTCYLKQKHIFQRPHSVHTCYI